jgi:hypothetical protein
MLKILVYTFFSYSKKTSKGLYELVDPQIDKLFIPNKFSTKKLVTLIENYDYVIGIADHRKNVLKSRFDPKYINLYSKNKIIENTPEYLLSNLGIDIPSNFYEFDGTTNGPCNRSAYLVMNKIIEKNLMTKFGFFHLKKEKCMKDLKDLLKVIRKR